MKKDYEYQEGDIVLIKYGSQKGKIGKIIDYIDSEFFLVKTKDIVSYYHSSDLKLKKEANPA